MDAFFQSTRIKVLVLPVGRIHRATFQNMLAVLCSLSSVALADLTPSVAPDQKGEFSVQSFRDGYINFEFCSEHDDDSSALEEFQKSKSILAILGILDCTECGAGKIVESYAKFRENVVPKFQSSLLHRCLAFSPLENQADNISDLIVIPDVGDINFYMATLIGDIAVAMLNNLKELASAIEFRSVIHSPPDSELGFAGLNSFDFQTGSLLPLSPLLGSPFQNTANTATTSAREMSGHDAVRLKRRSPGRASKLIADLLALAGNYPAAAVRYTAAIEAAKSQGDTLWFASALDGHHTMLLALRELGISVPTQLASDETAVAWIRPFVPFSEVVAKFHDVIAAYERAEAPLLVAESCLRLAHAMSHLNSKVEAAALHELLLEAALKNKGPRKLSAVKRINRIFSPSKTAKKIAERTLIAPPAATEIGALLTLGLSRCSAVSARMRLSLYLRAANLFESINFRRKQAFFMMAAVQLIIEILSSKSTRVISTTNFQLMETLALLYGLLSHDKIGWSTLQMEVLDQCILLSEAVEDPKSLTLLIVKCFQRFQSMLSLDGMLNIVSKLQRSPRESLETDDDPSSQQGNFKFLKSIELLELNMHLQPRERCQSEKSKGPFLYSALSVTHEKKSVHLVCGEVVELECLLENPFSFNINLDSLRLKVQGVSFTAESQHVSLLPSVRQRVLLSGVTHSVGVLRILGCEFKIFGVSEHSSISLAATPPTMKIKKMGMNIVTEKVSPVIEPSVILEYTVVDPLPVLQLKIHGAPQRRLVLLESQSKTLHLELTNVGVLPVTWVKFEVTKLQMANPNQAELEEDDEEYGSNDPIVMYRKDRYDLDHPVIECTSLPKMVEVRKTVSMPIKTYGKPNCVGATIEISYGNSGKFYRSIATQLRITVIPCVVISAFEVSYSLTTRNALLHIDFTNKHLFPVSVTLESSEQKITNTVPVSSTKRSVIELSPCDLGEAGLLAPVPALKEKQFIIKKNSLPSEAMRERTMCFWLEKHVLDSLKATWKSHDGLEGTVSLAPIKVTQHHVAVLWKHSAHVELCAVEAAPVPRVIRIRLRLHNKATEAQSFLLQLSVPEESIGLLGGKLQTLNLPPNEQCIVTVSALCSQLRRFHLYCHATRIGIESRLSSFSSFEIEPPLGCWDEV